MPESKSRKTGHNNLQADRARERAERRAQEQEPGPLPTWYKAVMFGLMIVGLFWIVIYYLAEGRAPLPGAGGWNIVAGFGIACIGFLMTTRWR